MGSHGNMHDEQIRHSDITYDRTDLTPGPIFGSLIALFVIVAIIHVTIWGFMRFLAPYALNAMDSPSKRIVNIFAPERAGKGSPIDRFPAPRLQPNPVADWKKFQAETEGKLNSYDWIDQNAGTVRIPVSRAIDILAEKGLPARSSSESAAVAPAAKDGTHEKQGVKQ